MKSLIPADTEVLAGLETGGIPLATALFLKTGIPPAFVRKEAKGYGTCNLIEGADIFNKKVCTLEDIITTARQVIKSVQAMREAGARIDTVLCLILREAAAIETLAKEGLTLKYVFTMDYIKKSAGIASR
ncbi:MAG: orotate phosphoribosyltransferase [Alphaproteobacteria bacterium]|nr:orotate phosphoribosyltransferase [Alphaproteobacteria bacterium]